MKIKIKNYFFFIEKLIKSRNYLKINFRKKYNKWTILFSFYLLKNLLGSLLKENGCKKLSGAFKPIGSHCGINDRCAGGSVCTNSTCICTDSSIELYGRCRQKPGGRCADGQICTGNAICALAKCQCPDGYILDGPQCILGVSSPGQSCQQGQKCANGSICMFGVCMCSFNFHIVDNSCKRLNKQGRNDYLETKKTFDEWKDHLTSNLKKPGESCIPSDFCLGGSNCITKMCICNNDEIISNDICIKTDQKVLIDNAAPGQYCREEIICTGGSVCFANNCTCPAGTLLKYGECINDSTTSNNENEFVLPGSICSQATKCHPSTECIRNVCRCKPGETIIEQYCRKALYKVLPGGKCDRKYGLDCVGESHCVGGICKCSSGLENGVFECVAKHNGLLNFNHSLQNPFYLMFESPLFFSQMQESSQLNTAQSNINPELTGMPGDRCTIEGFCWNGARCVNQRCICALGYSPINEACHLKMAKLHENCDITEQCPIYARCVGGFCTCQSSYIASSGYCIRKNLARPGEDCSNGQICGYRSYCDTNSGICECPREFSLNDGECMILLENYKCDINSDCNDYAFCYNGYCICDVAEQKNNQALCLPYYMMSDIEARLVSFAPFHSPHSFTTSQASFEIPVQFENDDGSTDAYDESDLINIGNDLIEMNQDYIDNYDYTMGEKRLIDARNIEQTWMPNMLMSPLAQGNPITQKIIFFNPNRRTAKLLRRKPVGYSKPGEACGTTKICIGNSICIGKFCRCKNGTIKEGSYCTDSNKVNVVYHRRNSVRMPLDRCDFGEKCLFGSICENLGFYGRICLCPTGKYLIDNVCREFLSSHALLNEYCTTRKKCVNGAICLKEKCQCGREDLLIFNHCLKSYLFDKFDKFAPILPGQICNNIHDSCVDNSFCSQKSICECNDGYKMISSRCIPERLYRLPGEHCTSSTFCGESSHCVDGICKAAIKRRSLKGLKATKLICSSRRCYHAPISSTAGKIQNKDLLLVPNEEFLHDSCTSSTTRSNVTCNSNNSLKIRGNFNEFFPHHIF